MTRFIRTPQDKWLNLDNIVYFCKNTRSRRKKNIFCIDISVMKERIYFEYQFFDTEEERDQVFNKLMETIKKEAVEI